MPAPHASPATNWRPDVRSSAQRRGEPTTLSQSERRVQSMQFRTNTVLLSACPFTATSNCAYKSSPNRAQPATYTSIKTTCPYSRASRSSSCYERRSKLRSKQADLNSATPLTFRRSEKNNQPKSIPSKPWPVATPPARPLPPCINPSANNIRNPATLQLNCLHLVQHNTHSRKSMGKLLGNAAFAGGGWAADEKLGTAGARYARLLCRAA
jgi:hypothetical protein